MRHALPLLHTEEKDREKILRSTFKTLGKGVEYIKDNRKITDVLVSGGDPFLLADDVLADILNSLRAISHVETIRIGTRVPAVLPQRITESLAKTLSQFQPIYINTHINHP